MLKILPYTESLNKSIHTSIYITACRSVTKLKGQLSNLAGKVWGGLGTRLS